jgi:hypothetical protein
MGDSVRPSASAAMLIPTPNFGGESPKQCVKKSSDRNNRETLLGCGLHHTTEIQTVCNGKSVISHETIFS